MRKFIKEQKGEFQPVFALVIIMLTAAILPIYKFFGLIPAVCIVVTAASSLTIAVIAKRK